MGKALGKLFNRKILLEVVVAAGVPAASFGVAGSLLDKKFGTSPWILLVAVLVALHVTLILVLVRMRKFFSLLSTQNANLKTQNHSAKLNPP